MYKLQNKTTGAEVTAMRFSEKDVLKRFDWEPIMDSSWDEFLLETKYSVIDDNWKLYLKLYESLIVKEGDWVIRNNEGFYFPISQKLLITLYTFVGSKPEGL